jgi:DNA polymerase III subunit delta
MLYKSYLIEENINNLNKELFLFFGENIGLKEEIKKKIKLVNSSSEILYFNQDEILKNNQQIFNEFNNFSLFEKEKIIFIDQVNDKILETIKEIDKKFDTQKMYLFSDLLDKKSKIRNYFEKSNHCGAVACYADNEISIKKIILTRLKGFEGLSPNNINLIVENSNLDRVKLNNEISKIVDYFQDKKILTNKLEKILDSAINDNFNAIRDGALNGNKISTNKLLNETVINAEKSIYYLATVNQRINKLSEVNDSKNIEETLNKMKPPIFWKDKPNFIIQAKRWDNKKIKKALRKTYELEIKIKTNSAINKIILIKKLMVDLCNLANA